MRQTCLAAKYGRGDERNKRCQRTTIAESATSSLIHPQPLSSSSEMVRLSEPRPGGFPRKVYGAAFEVPV
jgi:hypothetical protein